MNEYKSETSGGIAELQLRFWKSKRSATAEIAKVSIYGRAKGAGNERMWRGGSVYRNSPGGSK